MNFGGLPEAISKEFFAKRVSRRRDPLLFLVSIVPRVLLGAPRKGCAFWELESGADDE